MERQMLVKSEVVLWGGERKGGGVGLHRYHTPLTRVVMAKLCFSIQYLRSR